MSVQEDEKKPVTGEHLAWIDTFRGIAILAVLSIHILQRFFAPLPLHSPIWYAFVTLHRISFWAVPGFLMLSAMLHASSLLRKPDLKRYSLQRLQSVVWPYLVWSLVYFLLIRFRSPKGVSVFSLPGLLLTGKTWGHLYFMIVLIQLLILIPIMLPVLRRKPAPYLFALTAIVLTPLIYFGNRYTLHLTSPASFLLWYTPVLTFGFYLSTRIEQATVILKQAGPYALAAALVSLLWYLPAGFAMAAHKRLPFDNTLYHAAEWTFTTGMSIAVMAGCIALGEWLTSRQSKTPAPDTDSHTQPNTQHSTSNIVTAVLAYFGQNSLQIYLVHPLLLALLDKQRKMAFVFGVKGAVVFYYGAVLLFPLLLAELARRLKFAPLLFGR